MSSANNVVGAMTAYLVQGTAATNVSITASNARSSTQNKEVNFDSILNKVSDSLTQNRMPEASKGVNEAVQTKNTDISDKAQAKNLSAKDNSVSDSTVTADEKGAGRTETATDTVSRGSADDTLKGEVNEELQDAITEDSRKLIEQITETFDISEEDVVNAMQVLGLMAADLLNPVSLQELVTELTDPEQAIDLITDSDIYTSLQDLMEGAESMKSELMNEFDLSEEGLQEAIEENKNSFNQQLQTQIDEVKPEVVNERATEVKTDMNTTKTNAPQSEAFTDKVPVEEKPVEVITESSKNNSDNKGHFQSGAESSNLFNQVMNNIAEAAADVDASGQVSYTDRAQMEDIIRQITEKITISAKAEETSMELQLHPASLGNVNVLLTSGKDGIIAKFTAQNNIVKEAVEAQMVQLQQKFDEQGIKVNAIEVTIASHGFEQNLEQGNERQPGQAEGEKKVKPLRRINLSELEDEEVEEITSDAERIAVQMMAANGNSVDFSA